MTEHVEGHSEEFCFDETSRMFIRRDDSSTRSDEKEELVKEEIKHQRPKPESISLMTTEELAELPEWLIPPSKKEEVNRFKARIKRKAALETQKWLEIREKERTEKVARQQSIEAQAYWDSCKQGLAKTGSIADQNSSTDSTSTGFVYFVRNGDLFKIGITENMLRRLSQLSPDELLNVVRCTNFRKLERELHSRFKDVRLPQTEYFRLSDHQIQEVHRLMVDLADFPS